MAADARTMEILRILDDMYGTEDIIYLEHENDWQLLFATILSAQCTDARVNIVTRDLFQKYKTLEDFANASQPELEKDIHSIGFHRAKSKNIIACAKRLVEVYDGVVPRELDDLLTLAGVGRKTANVIRGNIYHDASIVVDTHVKRISKRLGFTEKDDPTDVEMDLMEVLPEEHWVRYNMQIITLGRTICFARKPHCSECPLNEICQAEDKTI